METRVQIDFQGMDPVPAIYDEIAEHVAELERFGRITACRVVVKGPGQHHHTGGLYEINVHLALPNARDVSVARTAQNDERHADIHFALNKAFKRARRQLQDRVRRLQRQTKHHEGAPTGRVVRIDPSGEFGFIETADGNEIYFHKNSVLNDAFSRLNSAPRLRMSRKRVRRGRRQAQFVCLASTCCR